MNFVGGELSPSVRARSDIKVFANGCERLENFILETVGPIKYRTGSVFVNPTRRNALGRWIPFQFSDTQAYLIECTPGFFRFYKDGGVIVDSDKSVTGITNAKPAVVTITAHGFSNEHELFFANTGFDVLDGKSFIVKNKTDNTFELYDEDGNAIDTISSGTYTSGGIANKIVEVETPYNNVSGKTDEQILEYLNKIQFSQNADTMYVVHPDYPPRKLTRSSHTAWTFTTYTRTADPFTGENKYPGAVSFDGAGRVIYGYSHEEPEAIWASRGPSSSTGEPRYDDMTLGTLANDGLKLYLAPTQGKVDAIQWLTLNSRYFLVGTFSGLIRLVSPSGSEEPFSAEEPPIARAIDAFGCEKIRPIPRGNLLFYLQRNSLILRCLEYDLVYDSYKSVDKNLVADTVTRSGIREIVFQHARPDVIWGVKKNGTLLGLTYHETEDVAGWHRQIMGRKGKVISAGIMARPDSFDQLWLMVERKINGKVRRYTEYISDFVDFLDLEDFYTEEENEKEDRQRFENDMYERQKLEVHLDCSMTYDGSLLGIDKDATLTIGTVTDGLATITSNKDIFSEGNLDRQIWRLHEEGEGTGRAAIVAYTDPKTVTCKIIKDFDVTTLTPGIWTLTTDDIGGLNHLEGETVSIVTDGAVHVDKVIQNGSIKLDNQSDVVHIGLPYRGLLKSMNIQAGGVSGSAQNKPRHVTKVVFEFLNTLGTKFGTGLYNLQKLAFRRASDRTNRPSPLFSGSKSEDCRDSTETRKHIYVVQDTPLPCTVQAVDIFMETIDE